MPTYQYACTACGEQLEAVQAFTDAPLTECAACGGRLRKVFSAVGVVFKGSGFYQTDSRSAKKEGGGTEGVPAATPEKTATPEKKNGVPAGSGASSAPSTAPSTNTPAA